MTFLFFFSSVTGEIKQTPDMRTLKKKYKIPKLLQMKNYVHPQIDVQTNYQFFMFVFFFPKRNVMMKNVQRKKKRTFSF